MNTFKLSCGLAAALMFASEAFTGCESAGDGTHVNNYTYYNSGYNDPWYHGQNDYDNVVVTPPPSGNPPGQGLRPTHPIAMPPRMPSIPSTPRPAMRR
jgi:hypothetical protein